MCGIGAALALRAEVGVELLRERVAQLATHQAHRGPDGAGSFANSASVGKISTLSASCFVADNGWVTPGATMMIGIRLACS